MSNPPEPFFPFEPAYLVGVEVLDRQHKEIVEQINQIHARLADPTPKGIRLEILTRLAHLAQTHFATEEQILRVHAFPAYLRHKAVHEGFTHHLQDFRGKVASGERGLTPEYVELVKLWLVDHFTEWDQRYAEFLRDQKTPASP